jgi:hypothetical protein
MGNFTVEFAEIAETDAEEMRIWLNRRVAENAETDAEEMQFD